MEKQRVNVWISCRNHKLLEEVTRGRDVTKTDIVDAALSHYFDPEREAARDDLIMARLDAFDLRQGAIERDLTVNVETLGQFILYWLTLSEPLPQAMREDAQRLGRKRFDYFIEQVGRRMGTSSAVGMRLREQLIPDEN